MCDVFVHTWDFNMQKPIGRPEDCTVEEFDALGAEAQRFRDIWNPVAMVVESYDMAVKRMEQERGVPACHPDRVGYRTNGVSDRWIPMYYSWYRSVLLKRDHELMNGFTYDLVVKLRPDVIYPRARSLQEETAAWQQDRSLFYVDCPVLDGRIDDVLWYASSHIMDRASCFWLAKLNHPGLDYRHHDYMMEQAIGLGSTGTGYAPLRPWCVEQGLDPLTQWGRIYAEDLRVYAYYHQLWDGKPVSFDEWLERNAHWLDEA